MRLVGLRLRNRQSHHARLICLTPSISGALASAACDLLGTVFPTQGERFMMKPLSTKSANRRCETCHHWHHLKALIGKFGHCYKARPNNPGEYLQPHNMCCIEWEQRKEVKQ